MAIKAYKTRQITSISSAARIFNVVRTTVTARMHGRTARQEKRANNHRLTRTEEETLVKWILAADERGLPIRPGYLRGLASILLQARIMQPDSQVGHNWVTRFIKRRPEIQSRYDRRISYQRAK